MRTKILFTGNSNPQLSNRVARHLRTRLSPATCSTFSDGESRVELEEHVRGQDVFLIQSTSAPTNQNVMELMIMIDAVRRSAPDRITVVIPYFGYSRQDRRPGYTRVPITSKLIANMLEAAGADYIVTVDIHAQQIQGFFDIPMINATAQPTFVADILKHHNHGTSITVVSPDVGGVARARRLAKDLNNNNLAIIDKRRPEANVAEVMNLIGDVDNQTCVLVDDIIDTAGTLCKAAAVLKENGATKVVAYCTHPVLSGPAIDNLNASELDELVVTDTIPLSPAAKKCKKIRVISIAKDIAETIRRIHSNESVSEIYEDESDV